MFHLDLSSGIEREFLFAGGSGNYIFSFGKSVFDYAFWHNDPSKYIYTGNSCGMDCAGFVERFDDSTENIRMFFLAFDNRIEISQQNDSILYSNSEYLLKSNDGGRNWFIIDTSYFYYKLVSLSPFNDNEVFVMDKKLLLSKSDDGGKSFSVVDTTFSEGIVVTPKFFYDKDTLHIYICFIILTVRIIFLYPATKAKLIVGQRNTQARIIFFFQ